MGSKKLLLVLVILTALLLPQIVFADLIPAGQKGIKHCFEITNMDEYQEYIFILDQRGAYNQYEIIMPDKCISFYKFNTGTIYAVEKKYAPFFSGSRHSEEGLNQSSPLLIKSDVQIKTSPYVSVLSPVESITDQYRIISIQDNRLELEKTTVKERNYSVFALYIIAFLFTVLLESLIIWPLAKGKLPKGFLSALKYSFLINIFTYPVILAVYLFILAVLLPLELGVFIAEIFLVHHFIRTSYKRAVLISFLANLVTMLFGFASFMTLMM